MRDWSAAAIDKRTRDLKKFDARYEKIDRNGWPIPQQVDYRLIGSALSRVHWELEVNPRWKRDPNFYIEQTLTPIVEALTVPARYDAARSREILTRIENVPSILQQAAENLDKTPGPFVTVAIQVLEGLRGNACAKWPNHCDPPQRSARRNCVRQQSRDRCARTFSHELERAIAVSAKRNGH